MTKIEVGKTYLQNNGAMVRILAIDLKNERPVLGAVLNKDGIEIPRTYFLDGKWERLLGPDPWGLVIPPERKSVWINYYHGDEGYALREEADECAAPHRTQVLEIITEDGKPVEVKIHEVTQKRATQGEG